jgi:hypothetical protein
MVQPASLRSVSSMFLKACQTCSIKKESGLISIARNKVRRLTDARQLTIFGGSSFANIVVEAGHFPTSQRNRNAVYRV